MLARSCMPAVKHSGPPDAGNPHVRWDEGGGAGLWAGPLLLYRETEPDLLWPLPGVIEKLLCVDPTTCYHCG